MFRAKLQNARKCERPAKLVEIELFPNEGMVTYGNEKCPDVREFIRWLGRAGVKKEIEENLDGTVEFKFYTRRMGRGGGWKLRKVYVLKPY